MKLFGISESSFINPLTNKKIIYLLGCIIKKRPRENVNQLLTKIMEFDDGSPLDGDTFDLLKSLIK